MLHLQQEDKSKHQIKIQKHKANWGHTHFDIRNSLGWRDNDYKELLRRIRDPVYNIK